MVHRSWLFSLVLALVLLAAPAFADRKVKFVEPEPADKLHADEKVLSIPVVDAHVAGDFKGFGPTATYRPWGAKRIAVSVTTKIKDRTVIFTDVVGYVFPAVREKEGFKGEEGNLYLVQEGDTLFRDDGTDGGKLTEMALVARDGRVILKRHELIYQVSTLVDANGVWRRTAGRLLIVPMPPKERVEPANKEGAGPVEGKKIEKKD